MPKKPTPIFRVHFEPVTEETEDAVLDAVCLLCFGLSLDRAAEAIHRNENGEYDRLYNKNRRGGEPDA